MNGKTLLLTCGDAARKLNPELFTRPATRPAPSPASPTAPAQPTTPPPQTTFHPGKSTDEAKLNKPERAVLEHLRALRKECIGVQSITLKLANDCRFTPDFSYLENGKLILIDVKGYQREDALIKIKVAARQFSWIEFQIVKKAKGGWDVRTVQP